ncbi:MAG: tRNA (adenosine(37)-N6)-threonylcarbamoyltransferase complex dimerization subunit type 1 TsaB [Sphingobacteriales bacterium]|nr:tRNA (adenosine(37)-N6)-threonylcarbamoyltransferase complex dimerization subunit type 1 TsaB [Sphingobacteriales bacterium]
MNKKVEERSIILCIDSVPDTCMVALSKAGHIVSILNTPKEKSHTEQLTMMINSVIKESKVEMKDIQAVAINAGPGSYTGLRIGTSTAKGLCFALNIPLIALNTLQIAAKAYTIEHGGGETITTNSYLVPLLEARRDEVFMAVYTPDMEEKQAPCVRSLHQLSLNTHTDLQKPLIVLGNAAQTYQQLQPSTTDTIYYTQPLHHTAEALAILAEKAYWQQNFQSILHFSPIYLKKFNNI